MTAQNEIDAAATAKPYTSAELEQLNLVVPWETSRLIATVRAKEQAEANTSELRAVAKSWREKAEFLAKETP